MHVGRPVVFTLCYGVAVTNGLTHYYSLFALHVAQYLLVESREIVIFDWSDAIGYLVQYLRW